jgi:hypothetical protein
VVNGRWLYFASRHDKPVVIFDNAFLPHDGGRRTDSVHISTGTTV